MNASAAAGPISKILSKYKGLWVMILNIVLWGVSHKDVSEAI